MATPDQCADRGFDGFGERRPRSHERGEVCVGDAPFAPLLTTPGTTRFGVGSRERLDLWCFRCVVF